MIDLEERFDTVDEMKALKELEQKLRNVYDDVELLQQQRVVRNAQLL